MLFYVRPALDFLAVSLRIESTLFISVIVLFYLEKWKTQDRRGLEACDDLKSEVSSLSSRVHQSINSKGS